MPLLYKEDRARMLGPTGRVCPKCNNPIQKNYCRYHDEFFEVCQCQQGEDSHVGHRTYICQQVGCINVITHHCFECKNCFCGQCATEHKCPNCPPPHEIGEEECECLLLG